MRQEEAMVDETTPDEGGGDRISALPDELLQHVLSFLTAQEAVRTCVLSRSWCHLWKSMPVLHVTSDRHLDRQGVKKLNMFLKSLVHHRGRSTPLDVCEFKASGFAMSLGCPQIVSLFQYALLCQARIIRVELDDDNECFLLGCRPLVSRHLTRLDLAYLSVDDGFLDFSSCPSLKEISIKHSSVYTEKLSSQSLKELTIIDCIFYEHRRTRISAPSLVRLELTDSGGITPVLEGMPPLVKAYVRLFCSEDNCDNEEFGGSCSDGTCKNCGARGDGNRGCVLLKGLSMAESLELIALSKEFIFRRDLMWCPIFRKLKTLLLNEWCVAIDFGALVCFLQHTPVLEKLILQLCSYHVLMRAPNNWMETGDSYSSMKQPFASKKLKVIEVKCEMIDYRIQKICTILSTHCICIELISEYRFTRRSECYSFDTMADVS
ncbi:hypothetical protein ACP70R_003837 [Stipagrostis hirtigluma subsp. patula]